MVLSLAIRPRLVISGRTTVFESGANRNFSGADIGICVRKEGGVPSPLLAPLLPFP